MLSGPGPGLWLEWLGELRRESLLEELLADGVIARALEEAPHGHACDRTLTGKMTVTCVLVACLFPGAGYDTVRVPADGARPLLRSGRVLRTFVSQQAAITPRKFMRKNWTFVMSCTAGCCLAG